MNRKLDTMILYEYFSSARLFLIPRIAPVDAKLFVFERYCSDELDKQEKKIYSFVQMKFFFINL